MPKVMLLREILTGFAKDTDTTNNFQTWRKIFAFHLSLRQCLKLPTKTYGKLKMKEFGYDL